MNIFSMTIEIVLACLLVIAIVYFWRLDQRLKALRSGRDNMLLAARELQNAVTHAQGAVEMLRATAEAAGRDLQAKIDEARALTSAPAQRSETSDFALRRRSVI
ncbi:MAG: DUF6468 domain-containing protein [Alphaproteobacteria bacterium]|nr:DUF6468 domain-containing protein [Alphaproteobacteria bacterium]